MISKMGHAGNDSEWAGKRTGGPGTLEARENS